MAAARVPGAIPAAMRAHAGRLPQDLAAEVVDVDRVRVQCVARPLRVRTGAASRANADNRRARRARDLTAIAAPTRAPAARRRRRLR